MIIELIANCIIRNQEGDILLVKEIKDPYWKLPGGKLESGESLEEAAMRETLEELGVQIEILNPFNTYETKFKGREFEIHVYEANIISGVPKVKEPHLESYEWVPLNLLSSKDNSSDLLKRIYKDLMERKNDSQ